jgi:hypothetical protein
MLFGPILELLDLDAAHPTFVVRRSEHAHVRVVGAPGTTNLGCTP